MRCRINQLRAAREDEGLQQGFDRATAATSTHLNCRKSKLRVTRVWPTKCGWEHIMCAPKSVNSKLHPSPPWVKGTSCCCYARTLQNMSVQGCFQHSKVIRVSPTKCCCKHTHVHCRNQGCTQGRNLIRASQTNCCCQHTHVCCRMEHLRVARKGQGLQGIARPKLLLRTCTCVLQKQIKSELHPRVEMSQRSSRPGAAVSTYTCVLQNNKTQGFTQGSAVAKAWPGWTTCRGVHTHVHCRIHQCRVAPRVKIYKGLADQMLLRVHTCLSQNRWFQGCTQGSKVTKVWPTSCCCEHTQMCC